MPWLHLRTLSTLAKKSPSMTNRIIGENLNTLAVHSHTRWSNFLVRRSPTASPSGHNYLDARRGATGQAGWGDQHA